MDISDTLAPNSDQLDAIDLLGGPRTFTITEVSRGKDDQPVQIGLAEFPRVWRPGKSMRRVLAACWGTDASAYVGRRVTLYCDEKVRFGSEVVGGTRIAALSNLDATKRIPLLVSRGKSAIFTVEPLRETAPKPPTLTPEMVAACTDVDQLREWQTAVPRAAARIEQRITELTRTPSGLDEFHPDTTTNPSDTLPLDES